MPSSTIVAAPSGWAVSSIHPVDGWQLRAHHEHDDDGFYTFGYSAARGGQQIYLNVSRFNFNPTQQRFSWLVENGFPTPPGVGPWTDALIDGAIAASRFTNPCALLPVSCDRPDSRAFQPRLQTVGDSLHHFMTEQFPRLMIGAGIGLALVLAAQFIAGAAS